MGKNFHRADSPRALYDLEHFWKYYLAPFRITPHTYCVGGNTDVAVYLIDTSDGLVLFDTGMAEFLYLVVDSIYQLGFNPRNIKKILLSHAHPDHVNGAQFLKQLSGADIYISREDNEFRETHPIKLALEVPYDVDRYYSDTEPIVQGQFAIHTLLTPGHTPGTTSFFYTDVDDLTGETYHVGFHGGVGCAQMAPQYLADNNLSQELAFRFMADCAELRNRPIDITLPSHLNQINLVPNIPDDHMDYSPFVDRNIWIDLMDERIAAVRAYYE